MCLAEKVGFNNMLQIELDKKWYRRYEKDWLEPGKMRRRAFIVAAKLSKFVSPEILRDIKNPINHAKSLVFSRMKCTIKTHKPAGQISLRPLHTSVGHYLSGFAAWVDLILGSILKNVRYICKCSDDVIRMVDSISLNKDACLCKCDVKDFFLDGEHASILRLCVDCVRMYVEHGHTLPGVCHDCTFDIKVFEEVLSTILEQQFVDVNLPHLYQVVRGSGMGHKHSASVSSCSLWMLCERQFVSTRESHDMGLLMYGRYHDDVIFAAKNSSCVTSLVEHFRVSASECYTITVDEISTSGVNMLDLHLYKGHRFGHSGHLDYKPYIKATARHIPLSQHSSHSPSIHN